MDDTSDPAAEAASPAASGPECGSNPGALPVEIANRPATRPWRLGIPIAVLLLGLLVFVPALAAGFVHWDDDDLILGETHFREVSLETLEWMWTTSYAGHFQPLTWLSYAFDFSWSGHDAFGYHLTNVALHLVNTALFYWLALRLLRRGVSTPWRRESKTIYLSAGFAAALFSIHPLRVESVAWIAERRDVLSGAFYLLAMLFYIAFASAVVPDSGRTEVAKARVGGRLYYVASFVCFSLSLLAKASAVMLPMVFLVLDLYPLRRLAVAGRSSWSKVAHLVVEKLPFFIVAAAVGIRALVAQQEGGALYPLTEYDAASRLAQASYGLAFYVWKTLIPIGLGPMYPLPPAATLFGAMLWTGVLTVLALVAIAVVTRRRFPIVPTVLATYAIQLLPVLGLFQSGPQLVADRYSYLPCLGLAVLGGAGLLWLLNSRPYRMYKNVRAAAVLAISLAFAGLAHATFQQASYWDSPLALWRRGVAVSPESSIANVNYADALAEYGELGQAVVHYDRALKLEPRDPIAASHFGRVLLRVGEPASAAELFAQAVRLDPERAADWMRLSETLVDLDRPNDAATALRNRAHRAPHDLLVVEMLADLLATHRLASVRNGEEAVRWATHAHRARGGSHAPTMLVLASALAEAGQFDRAVSVGTAALEVARASRNERLARELLRRIAMFEAGRPYHFGD